MANYTNAEMDDMHLLYGAANGNGREAARMYNELYPDRRTPNHQTFAQLGRRLCETGTFRVNRTDAGRPRYGRTPHVEEDILAEIEHNPQTSSRAVGQRFNASQQTVLRVLHDYHYHPYHYRKVQALLPNDYPQHVAFAQWFQLQTAMDPNFPSSVLFTDEATFTQDGVFNLHNRHNWAQHNPHVTHAHEHQHRFAVNVWAGIVNNSLIGPYLLPARLNGAIYLVFLREVLPELLEDVPLATLRDMRFQHDDASVHFTHNVREYLNETLGDCWIGRGGPTGWPPQSPDLTCVDFYFWGHLKELVYATPVTSVDDLIARITVAADTTKDIPGIFEHIRQSMLRRCQACITVSGRNFEQLL